MNIKYSTAINVLKSSGVIVVQTDTVPGLAADPENKPALKKIYKLKARNPEKSMVFMLPDVKSVEKFVFIPDFIHPIINKSWPGALTIIFNKNENEHSTLGIRIPNHNRLRTLLRFWGKPLGVTSVNRSGSPPLLNMEDIKKSFGASIGCYLESKNYTPSGKESTIIDVSKGKIEILRQGEVEI